jgi:hypothetical protein
LFLGLSSFVNHSIDYEAVAGTGDSIMKKMLIGALASLMLAGALAGATQPTASYTHSMVVMLGDGVPPMPIESPMPVSYGDSSSQ